MPAGEPRRALGTLIHRSAWKINSANFACIGFSEVRMHGVLASSIEDLHPFSFQHFLGSLPRPDKRMMCP
jgi:hypothetical protein